MTIERVQNGSELTLKLDGRLDTKTAPDLEEALRDLKSVTELVIDLEKTEYVSSAGLRVLLKAKKAMYGEGYMKLKNLNSLVKEVLEITGLTSVLSAE